MLNSLDTHLSQCRSRDRFEFKKRASRLQKKHDPSQTEKLQTDIEASKYWVQTRKQRIPHIEFPENLPVSQAKSDIQKTILAHQVVVLAGETGSGKTTQLPKMLLELGFGAAGLIGHTQPRRLAARTVARRIAEELGQEGTKLVGTKIRFQDETTEDTAIKLMTDGILLAELQQDPFLSDYEVIIIDEAHERSLNIDFLLGVLHQIIQKRADLKVIITSATIETERFSKHFNQAPVLEVSGRTYPVEVRYQPLTEAESEEDSLYRGVADAAFELMLEGPGDILVFLSGEREIHELTEFLTDEFAHEIQGSGLEILPLYARLAAQAQNKVFQTGRQRRIVLATNVAETSVTVPGIRFVIDTGFARVSRYSYRRKIQRLPIEKISQASANQRAGRCGRLGPGICIRLYEENDYFNRPEYTDPEILRTNLAAVILQMIALRLGDIRKFPFIQKPDERYIKDGVTLLNELQAVEPSRSSKSRRNRTQTLRLTPLGKQIARLPVDPRLGAMVVAAQDKQALKEVLVIVAALSTQDPRLRPQDKQQAADEKHQRFQHQTSDFLSYLALWEYLQAQQKELKRNAFRKLCQKEFIHYLRFREWQDVYVQLEQSARQLKMKLSDEPALPDMIHQAMLVGLLSNIGTLHENHEYMGARQSRFYIFPGSGLFKQKPKWLMAAELVETSQLFARDVAAIKTEWIEAAGSHLLRRNYHEPRYSKRLGAVIANEQVTLFGLLIVAQRSVQYGQINPVESREIFIRAALVEGEINKPPAFVTANKKQIEAIQNLEDKSRRKDILVDDETLFAAYDALIPEAIYDERSLRRWWRQLDKVDQQNLYFSAEDLMQQDAAHVTEADYPESWQQGAFVLPLSYVFEPSHEADGVSVEIPLSILNQIEATGFDWQIPAFRHELVMAYIRSLPRALRRNFVPAPNYADAVLQAVQPMKGTLVEAMTQVLKRMSGIDVPKDSWAVEQIPEHLRFNFKVVDAKGKLLGQGRDLAQLKASLTGKTKQLLKATKTQKTAPQEMTDWEFDTFPQAVTQKQGQYSLQAFPALVDKKSAVAFELFASESEAQQKHQIGLRRLIYLQMPSPISYLQEQLSLHSKLAMYFNPWGNIQALIEDCIHAVIDYFLTDKAITNKAEFKAVVNLIRAELNDKTLEILKDVEACLLLSHQINKAFKGRLNLQWMASYQDMQSHFARLMFPGFLTAFGIARLPDIKRYLKALSYRIDKLPVDPNKDRQQVLLINKITQKWEKLGKDQPNLEKTSDFQNFRWQLEELRVSYFAQVLGTAFPVSEQRLDKYLKSLSNT